MKPGTILDPTKINEYIKNGDVAIGCELEFSNSKKKWFPDKLNGCDIDLCDDDHQWSCGEKWKRYARIPMPKLKNGDPIVVEGTIPRRMHFSYFDSSGQAFIYPNGTTRWTHTPVTLVGPPASYRLPTPDELESGGYPRDYYTSR